MPETVIQQGKVSEAFSKQSVVFDDLDKSNPIIQWMRNKIRSHVLSQCMPGGRMLELNAGTGLDAVFFAQHGLFVYATDNAEGMINELNRKAEKLNLGDKISTEKCSFTELDKLQTKEFDYIFSNFGGLNCTDRLDEVIQSFSHLLKSGGKATLVIMPPVSPWELLMSLKGNFKVAFRRLKKNGTPSNVEGVSFKSYYYSPRSVAKMFGNNYNVIAIKGLGSIVPPPFLDKYAVKSPGLFKILTVMENAVSNAWPFNAWADHFIITMQKNA